MPFVYENYVESAAYIRRLMGERRPEVLLILGSGLGYLAEQVQDPVVIPYGEIPHFAVSTVSDHAGRFVIGTLGGRCVIEQFVSGREIQVGILEGKALPSIEIIPKEGFYDYENKYQPGAADEICPAQIPQQWEQKLAEAALKVFHGVGLAVYSRADFIVTPDGTPWFLEINTLPGMTPTSLLPQEAAVVGIDYGSLCERIIEASLEARKAGR